MLNLMVRTLFVLMFFLSIPSGVHANTVILPSPINPSSIERTYNIETWSSILSVHIKYGISRDLEFLSVKLNEVELINQKSRNFPDGWVPNIKQINVSCDHGNLGIRYCSHVNLYISYNDDENSSNLNSNSLGKEKEIRLKIYSNYKTIMDHIVDSKVIKSIKIRE